MVDSATFRNLGDVASYVGPDGATVRELAGRSTGLSGHSLALITHPAGTASVAHHHSLADEIYFVSAGNGGMTVDGEMLALAPGAIVQIRPDQVHKVWSIGPEDLVLIVTCAPAYSNEEVVWDE